MIRNQGSDLSRTGAVAQLGERLLCKQEVVGSIPSSSTRFRYQNAGIRDQKIRHLSVARKAAFNSGLCTKRSKLRAAVFFNNSEGKGSRDLMRVS